MRHIGSKTDSPDASVHVEANANVNYNRFTLPKDPREIVFACVLTLSVMVNLWCGWLIRDIGTAKWLHDWDLNQFQNGPYVETKIKVGELDARVRAIETSQACKR